METRAKPQSTFLMIVRSLYDFPVQSLVQQDKRSIDARKNISTAIIRIRKGALRRKARGKKLFLSVFSSTISSDACKPVSNEKNSLYTSLAILAKCTDAISCNRNIGLLLSTHFSCARVNDP